MRHVGGHPVRVACRPFFLASGDVQLSVSQGVPPIVVAASGGQDLQILDVAVSQSYRAGCSNVWLWPGVLRTTLM